MRGSETGSFNPISSCFIIVSAVSTSPGDPVIIRLRVESSFEIAKRGLGSPEGKMSDVAFLTALLRVSRSSDLIL